MMKLQPGDILLYRETKHSPIHDKLISLGELLLHKQFTKSSFYHVAMMDTDTELMLEAVWPKTHVTKLVLEDVEIYRVKAVTKKQVRQAIRWAHQNLGVWYSVIQLLFGILPSKHRYICSTYVAKAWESAGVSLGNINERIFSPDEIAACKLLRRVN